MLVFYILNVGALVVLFNPLVAVIAFDDAEQRRWQKTC